MDKEKKIFPRYSVEVDEKNLEITGMYDLKFTTFNNKGEIFQKEFQVDKKEMNKEHGEKLATEFGIQAKDFFDSKKKFISDILMADSSYELVTMIDDKINSGWEVKGGLSFLSNGKYVVLIIKQNK